MRKQETEIFELKNDKVQIEVQLKGMTEAVELLKKERERLTLELMQANDAVRICKTTSSSRHEGPIYLTPTGECWHRIKTCGGTGSFCRRPCARCVTRGSDGSA